MGQWRCVRILVVALGVAALGGPSCGSDTNDAGRIHDAGVAHDGGDAGADAARCLPPGDETAEPPAEQVAFDGGVPIDQLTHALAVARCNYMSRCFALSTYVANECITSIENNGTWGYEECGFNVVGFFCGTTIVDYPFPNAGLLQAVAMGVVRYDAQQEGKCLAALLAEGCAGYELFENIPACTGIFTCASGVDGGTRADGGAADGGLACALVLPASEATLHTCATDDDCVGVTGYQQGPDCVAGICAASRCGIDFNGCVSYAEAGESCSWNAITTLNSNGPNTPGNPCAPGLACHGQTANGGASTCVVPQDVGGTCTDDTNCKPGLTCTCGSCQIPPSSGACVNGLCEMGVAYCDVGSNVCHPVRPFGASCADAINSCGPGLSCNGGVCGRLS